MRADSVTHYVSKFQVYTGRPCSGQESGLGEQIVTELPSDLVNGHYHLYFDNFFSCFRLMKSLLEKGINATATTHPNQKGFPASL